MTVQVRLFASLAERVGSRTLELELEQGATVAGAWTRLVERYPSLAESGVRPLVACDMVYAAWDAPLEGVREIAFLPPVSGG
jgi:molybdopterin converting factor subunit 1